MTRSDWTQLHQPAPLPPALWVPGGQPMSPELQALLGKYLTKQGIEFTSIERVVIDGDTGTLDIDYRDKSNRFDVEEIWDLTSFLEFLIDED